MDSMDKLRTRVEQLEQCIDAAVNKGIDATVNYLEARIVYLETRENNRDRNALEPGNVVEVGKPVPACTPDMKKSTMKIQKETPKNRMEEYNL